MVKIHVFITHYRRREMLLKLLAQIEDMRGGFDASVVVYDDHTPIQERPAQSEMPGATLVTMPRNYGKMGYWRLINRALQDAYKMPAEFIFMLQDDVELTERYFERAMDLFASITSRRKACLHTLLLRGREGKARWTDYRPMLRPLTGGGTVWQTQWTDCNFLCTREMFRVLGWKLNPIAPTRWHHAPMKSSGVGEQISLRVHGTAYNLYQPTETLLLHGAHESRMFPGRPRSHLST